MKQSRWIAVGSIFLAAALSGPLWGADPAQPGNSKVDAARPGSLNYVEGQVSIDGQSIGPDTIGKTELNPGQSLETQVGKAELLLTPGIFFRIGDNSSVTVISPSSTDTELRLDKGEAIVEAAELRPQTDIVVAVGDARVRLAETGLYDIDADQNIVRVYQGQVYVDANNREIAVKNQQQLAFDAGASVKPETFNQDQSQSQAAAQDQDQAQAPDPGQDDLYPWSSLRSSYLAEANVDSAQDNETGSSSSDGWDWDPYYGTYTFIPTDGTIFYSPFGWGFYSPYGVGYAPFGFYGHYYHHFDDDYHHWDHGDHHEAHYYDHFDHGAYRGPGSGYYGGEGFHGGEGYGGRGGEGSHAGHGGEVWHGGEGSQVGRGGEGFHGAGSSGGSRTMGGGGTHSGGGFGGSHGTGGGASHGGGGGGHR